jgi:hypothetical protein
LEPSQFSGACPPKVAEAPVPIPSGKRVIFIIKNWILNLAKFIKFG